MRKARNFRLAFPVVVDIQCNKLSGPFCVTVQTCGDLPTIRPIVEGQPSTEFPLQTAFVPSNVNSYPLPYCPQVGLAVEEVRLFSGVRRHLIG